MDFLVCPNHPALSFFLFLWLPIFFCSCQHQHTIKNDPLVAGGNPSTQFLMEQNNFVGVNGTVNGDEIIVQNGGRTKRGRFYNNYYSSSRGYECDDECGQHGGSSYFWCRVTIDTETWDYCSPTVGFDYYMRPCRTVCGHYGQKYKWCYVGRSWGYCSFSSANQIYATWVTTTCLIFSPLFFIRTD